MTGIISKAIEYAFTNELRSSSQICGPASKARAMDTSMISTASPCLPVSRPSQCWLPERELSVATDYRIPQMLHYLSCLQYSPPLESHIRRLALIESGHPWEMQLRGCSIWCVELLRREIVRRDPGAQINAILMDFFLYDAVKEMEAKGIDCIPHHRTRSIWY